MPENQPPQKTPPTPKKEPYSAGVLMAFGIGLIVVAVWTAKDFFRPPESWPPSYVWMNGIAALASTCGAVYAFVLAALRARKAPPKEGGQ